VKCDQYCDICVPDGGKCDANTSASSGPSAGIWRMHRGRETLQLSPPNEAMLGYRTPNQQSKSYSLNVI